MTRRLLPLLAALVIGIAGCHNSAPPTPTAAPPVVVVAQPIEREVIDYIEYTGRTDSVNAVEIRPRVTGYLVKMPFKEGSEVKAGNLLFEVDKRPYKALLDQANGQVELARARLKLAIADNARAKVIAQTPGAISQQDLDKYQAAEEEALAAIDAAVANLETYKLNLSFCDVTSPIDGQVSRYLLTLGNLVNQDQTLLTTVVSLDPMYAYFDVDERTLLRVREAINSGKMSRVKQPEQIPVQMGIQGEPGYPHLGVVNFINNQVDPMTGTITLRGVFPNPRPENGVRLLSPGLFVRVRVPLGAAHPALLVTDQAVGTDQSLKYLYVVDKDNKVQYRRVTLGALQDDGLRVIASGLEKGDWVMVSGLQQSRPGMVVNPQRQTMPIPVDGSQSDPIAAPAATPAANNAAKVADDHATKPAAEPAQPAAPLAKEETPAPAAPAVPPPHASPAATSPATGK